MELTLDGYISRHWKLLVFRLRVSSIPAHF